MLDMTSTAPTNAGKHVTPNIACVRSQRYTKGLVLQFGKMTLCIVTLSNIQFFVRPNVISDGHTNPLSIHQSPLRAFWALSDRPVSPYINSCMA